MSTSNAMTKFLKFTACTFTTSNPIQGPDLLLFLSCFTFDRHGAHFRLRCRNLKAVLH